MSFTTAFPLSTPSDHVSTSLFDRRVTAGISDELSADSTSDMWSPLLPAKCHVSWSLPVFISPTPLSPVSNTPGVPVILSPSLTTYVRTGLGGGAAGCDGVLVAGTDGVVVAGCDGAAGCEGVLVAGADGVVVAG